MGQVWPAALKKDDWREGVDHLHQSASLAPQRVVAGVTGKV